MTSTELSRLWPAAGLRVAAGDLELRWIDDDLLLGLADLAARGVHDDGVMPFRVPWSRGTPEQVARRVLAFHWDARAKVGHGELVLELAVMHAGTPVGVQGISGSEWSILREVETGSWLGRAYQGQGIGARMRALMLHLAFEGLGAHDVTSTAFIDNAASNAVSQRVGYEPDGVERTVRDDEPATWRRYRMTRVRWEQVREANSALIGAPVEITGIEPLLVQLDG
ncbi:GNAT family N-acetyltransferase [Microbacterium sp. 18062]|uniref:GNAT family N-acetyltransferase n=1 Tax=Microbacterium sp. 18062 TaxID=2681410 RepID=UPI00135AFDD0|nr:GNAT family protein [Microbacterium sp. 18062]